MTYITITTPENIEINYRLAGTGSRLAAAVIDLLIQFAAILAVSLACIAFMLGIASRTNQTLNISNMSFAAIAVLLIVFFIICFLYYIMFEMLNNGQTPGKKLFGLRVIKRNGQPITLTQSLVRNVLRYFIDLFGIGVISIFISKSCARIGDLVASTCVVSENIKTLKNNSLLTQTEQKTPIADQYRLSKEEFTLLNEYFARYNELSDKGFALYKQFSEYFAKRFNVSQESITVQVLQNLLQMNANGF